MKDEWRVLSSQTIGVEFASKIIRVGTGARRKRIKLQVLPSFLFSRTQLTSPALGYSWHRTLPLRLSLILSRRRWRDPGLRHHLPPNLHHALLFPERRSRPRLPNLTLLLAGNKVDLADSGTLIDVGSSSLPPATPSSVSSKNSSFPYTAGGSVNSTTSTSLGLGAQLRATVAPDGREVSAEEASKWASSNNVPVSVEVSALSGENVEEVFNRLARMILTKIELGEIDPDDPMSGIQYGDAGWIGDGDGASVKSGMTADSSGVRKRRKAKKGWGLGGGGMREWEEVFTLSGNRRRTGGCC